jgi:predicted dehydrogenase
VQDLTLPRPNAQAHHIIAAIGSSSLQKGKSFVASHIPTLNPTVHDSYDAVYSSVGVDIVYIGTPHAFHKESCLAAIRAHKHVLCEKAFTLTARDAEEVLAAAKQEGVFIMEAMWTRFTPLVAELRTKIFEQKAIGEVRRTFCDFGLDMDIAALGSESRLKNPKLGAGSLLDIGIYSLTWGLLTLDPDVGDEAEEELQITGVQSLHDGIDIASMIVLKYPRSGRQGILTSTTEFKTSEVFCRIEGTEGHIEVRGPAASAPSSFTIHRKRIASSKGDPSVKREDQPGEVETYTVDKRGFGFYWEADAVAVDIANGQLENRMMPHAETLRVMRILDEVRRQGGARFAQDEEL